MAEKELKKGEKDIDNARKERAKGKYKKAARKFRNAYGHFSKAAIKFLIEGAKKSSGPADDVESSLKILRNTKDVLYEFLSDENLRKFWKIDESEITSIEDWIELLRAWPQGFEEIKGEYKVEPVPVWALLESVILQTSEYIHLDFMGLAFLGGRSLVLYGVEMSESIPGPESLGYHGRPNSKIVKVEIPFTGEEVILRGYDESFKRRYLVGPPIKMRDVSIDGELKMIYVLPSNPHISSERLRNTNLDEVLKLIPPGYWDKDTLKDDLGNIHTLEDDFGASELLFKSLSKLRAEAKAAPRAPKATIPPPSISAREPVSKPATIDPTEVTKFCAQCGRRLESEDIFCGNCGAKIKD